MIARQISAAAFFVLFQAGVPAAAMDNRYPDWPCQQLKVPELSVAAIWPEPIPEQSARPGKPAAGPERYGRSACCAEDPDGGGREANLKLHHRHS